jgi:hypothetical protein
MDAFYMHHHVSQDSVGLKQVIICSSPYDTHVTARVTISHIAALKCTIGKSRATVVK